MPAPSTNTDQTGQQSLTGPDISGNACSREAAPEAESAIERLAVAPADERLVIREIWLLRLHALLARAHGDEASYRDYRDRYREMATSLGFEGHIAGAEAMP